ncbi:MULTISPECIES: hypothetical protein [unclassified Clostridium]|uniref:hypothetical protein n=1 Tax=unclassified Clostridium TaxID=2614128 RepID=UPI000E93FE27|nr:hypothetical protein [Clostridium sp.]
MLLDQILCIILILISIFIIIKPLKIMNTIRVMFILQELDKEDPKVFFYRFSGIAGVLIFGLLLLQTFSY